MASNYIPYLPSSPPPFDVAARDDDDEEGDFGTFTCAMYANDVDTTDGDDVSQKPKSGSPSHLKSDCCVAPEQRSSDIKGGTSSCGSSVANVNLEKEDVNTERENAFQSESSPLGPNHLCVSDGNNEIVSGEDVDKPPAPTGFSAADCDSHAVSPVFNSLQPDSTSQDSATDSGMCSGSAYSEGSPLPKTESAFAEFSQGDAVSDAKSPHSLPAVATDFGGNAADCDSEEWADFSSATPVSGVDSDNVSLTDIALSRNADTVNRFTSTLSKHSNVQEADSSEQHSLDPSEMPVNKIVQSDVDESNGHSRSELCFKANIMSDADCCHFQSQVHDAEYSQSSYNCTTDDACLPSEPSLKNAVSQESLVLPALPNSDDTEAKSDSDEYDDFVCISTASMSFPERLSDRELSPVKQNEWLSAAPSSSHLVVETDHSATSSGDPKDDVTSVQQPPFEASFEDEFGTFSSASSDLVTQVSSITEQVLASTFPPHPIEKDVHVELLEALLSDAGSTAKLQSSTSLWANLGDIEKTDALTYQWNSSISSKKLLKALNIDSRNLLFGDNWNSSVPLFATILSLNPLEPTKTPLKTEEKVEDKEVPPSSQTQEVIPAAQFDWRSSGLVNPLDASNNASALLDLDYFFTNDSTPITPVPSATWSLENELLGPASESKVPSVASMGSKMSPFLEQILSSAKFTAGTLPKPKVSPNLSEEAQRVLNKLPNLSFMQAKVLMFPIRCKSP